MDWKSLFSEIRHESSHSRVLFPINPAVKPKHSILLQSAVLLTWGRQRKPHVRELRTTASDHDSADEHLNRLITPHTKDRGLRTNHHRLGPLTGHLYRHHRDSEHGTATHGGLCTRRQRRVLRGSDADHVDVATGRGPGQCGDAGFEGDLPRDGVHVECRRWLVECINDWAILAQPGVTVTGLEPRQCTVLIRLVFVDMDGRDGVEHRWLVVFVGDGQPQDGRCTGRSVRVEGDDFILEFTRRRLQDKKLTNLDSEARDKLLTMSLQDS